MPSSSTTKPTQPTQPARSAGKAALLLFGIVLAVAGFVAIGQVLALTPLYAGFLFLWYWGTIEEIQFSALPRIICGAVGGIATAWLLQYCTVHHGMTGIAVFMIFILCIIFIQIMNWLPLIINAPFMLFLTVMTAPLLQQSESFADALLAVLIGSVYFGSFIFLGSKAMALLTPKNK